MTNAEKLLVYPRRRTVRFAVLAVLSLTIYGCQPAGSQSQASTPEPSVTELQKQLSAISDKNEQLKSENEKLKASNSAIEKQLADYQTDSSQETLIYDNVTLLGGSELRWKIPAKVRPEVVGNKKGAFYRYLDPKTNVGTDRFDP